MKKREIMFKKPFEETENIVKASYVISELIAKHSKCFGEGEFIKEHMLKLTEITFPGKLKTVQNISVSRNSA